MGGFRACAESVEMIFQHLRTTPWEPTFQWVSTLKEVADLINKPHEDYPERVLRTEKAILHLTNKLNTLVAYGSRGLFSSQLRGTHKRVFGDTRHAGCWRQIEVRVGLHTPPRSHQVPRLMGQLEGSYFSLSISYMTIEKLIEWYKDFETVHPFQDGNGRVGGITLAAYSHKLHPEQGYLAVNQ